VKTKYFFNRICIILIFLFALYTMKTPPAEADFWGGDLPLLAQILAKSIEQIRELQEIIGSAQNTVSILEDMNRGVKEVLKLADTAHIQLPKQVYEDAKSIDSAFSTAERLYGMVSKNAPIFQKTHHQSGVEGLFISQDAFEYSTFLDKNGESVKRSAVVANQATATRLTAETLGVLLHAVSHTNRILAKDLEISSTSRLEQTAKENAQFDTYIKTSDFLEDDFSSQQMVPLNSFGNSNISNGGHE
jgi:hypothetical protein